MIGGKGKTCPECGFKFITKTEICPRCVANSTISKYQQSTVAKKAVDYALGHVGVNWATKAAAGFIVRRAVKSINNKKDTT